MFFAKKKENKKHGEKLFPLSKLFLQFSSSLISSKNIFFYKFIFSCCCNLLWANLNTEGRKKNTWNWMKILNSKNLKGAIEISFNKFYLSLVCWENFYEMVCTAFSLKVYCWGFWLWKHWIKLNEVVCKEIFESLFFEIKISILSLNIKNGF